MSRVGSLSNPDFVLIDLDPYHCGYDRIVEAAQLVRSKLEQMGLQGFAKTTGGDGMHIYVPLEPIYNYEQVRSFAEIVSRIVSHERPDLFTTPRTVKQREKGKVYFDYLQIREGATISAPYVLRAYPGAPVSTPLRWSEVQRGLSPQQFNVRNAPDRFARLGDLFAPVLTLHQKLETAIERLQGMMSTSGKTKG
jgi:bifunctional non-homologous end joining protein LigD